MRAPWIRRRPAALAGLVAAAALGLLGAACGPTAGTEDPGPSPDPLPAVPEPLPPAPLTGLEVDDERTLERPLLAIKVENSVASRPPAGLDLADVVFEMVVEGGITRFVALYHSTGAPDVGPVRSVRESDPELLHQFGRPLFAYSGAAAQALAHLRRFDVVELSHDRLGDGVYRRHPGRRMPHNLFTDTDALWAAGQGTGATPPRQIFQFGNLPPPPPSPSPSPVPGAGDEEPPPPPEPRWPGVSSVRIPFLSGPSYTTVWTWDPLVRRYLRSHGGTRHVSTGGEQITARNVLIMEVVSRPSGRRDSSGASVPVVVSTGAGRAVLLRDGVRIEGTWRRPTIEDATVFMDLQGREFVLAPGRTWVELVPGHVRPVYAEGPLAAGS